MKFSKIVVSCLLLALLVAVAVYAAQVPTVGTKAPDFTLNSQEDKPISLHDFKGKWVVLYFYPKDQTPGCTIEAHGFQRDLAQYDKKNAVIVGVSVDSVGSHKEWCAKDSLTFKMLSDEKHEVVNTYGSVQKFGANEVAARNTFLVDPNGVIQKVFEKVNPEPHSVEVLAALGELQKK